MKTAELLIKGLKELDITCTEPQINAFLAFLSELKKWNRRYNLTALKTNHDIVIKHFIDSLLYLKAIPEHCTKMADAGAGAGFPGIPIKIIRPEIEMTLIEPTRKKASFLRHIIRQLKLSEVDVLDKRIENLGIDYNEKFDVIVSRATFSIINFLKAADPFVKKSGILVLNKGPKVSEELNDLKRSPYPGSVIRQVLQAQLPLLNIKRNIVVLTPPEL